MEFRLLGQVEVTARGLPLAIESPQQRLLLAALAVDAGRLVTVESLMDRLWDDAPRGARRALHVLISRLRRALAAAAGGREQVVVRHSGGYVLQVDPRQVDVHQFRGLASARYPGASTRVEKLREALAWWRGEPLLGLRGEWAARVRAAWRQEYLDVVVAWAEAELRAGDPAAVVGPLTALAAEYPLAESLAEALVRTLSAVGRPADALAYYGQVRQRLADELGASPGPGMQAAYHAVLRGKAVQAGKAAGTSERAPVRQAKPEPDPARQPSRGQGTGPDPVPRAEPGTGARDDAGLSPDERCELAELRRENRRLREDIEILKRATAFFAKQARNALTEAG
jgi:DNA-binding SARP family transcriptional activator